MIRRRIGMGRVIGIGVGIGRGVGVTRAVTIRIRRRRAVICRTAKRIVRVIHFINTDCFGNESEQQDQLKTRP